MKIQNKKQAIFIVLKVVAVVAIIAASGIIIKDEIFWQLGSDIPGNDIEKDNCNVAGIVLQGSLVTYISPADYDIDGNLLVDQTSSEYIVYSINMYVMIVIYIICIFYSM